jgi:CRP-like cAMP-binding protein
MNSSERNETALSSEVDQNLELLRQTYFFSGLPVETIKVFAYLCTREVFKRGEYLFNQGEDDGQAFYIIDGEAVIERNENGATIRFRTLTAGEFLGGFTLMGAMQRLFSLKAESDVNCLILNREKFSKALEQFQDLIPNILKALVQVIDQWEERFLISRPDQCEACQQNLGVSLL